MVVSLIKDIKDSIQIQQKIAKIAIFLQIPFSPNHHTAGRNQFRVSAFFILGKHVQYINTCLSPYKHIFSVQGSEGICDD